MATIAPTGIGARARPIAPDAYERALSIGAILLLGCVVVALAKGHAEWPRVPAIVWPHLLTIVVALALTPVILLRRRGDRRHRMLGTIWAAAMLATAVSSFFIRAPDHGGWSVIHILSVVVLAMVPRLWWSARRHRVDAHRRSVRALVTGALLIAGFFTFPFDRLLGHWLFG